MNQQDIKDQLRAMPAPFVIIGVGVPGSGKTTILKKLLQGLQLTYICPDDIREELSGDAADQSVNTAAWNEAYRRAKVALHSGNSVLIDATHAEAWRRPEMVKLYKSFGAKSVVAIFIKVPLEVAKQRNANRQRVVPEKAIERMWRALEKEPPSVNEGLDKVIIIKN